MTTRKSPPLCKGTGNAPTNRKEKQMHTDSTLNSDELFELIQDFFSFYDIELLVSSYASDFGHHYTAHLDSRFEHPEIVINTNREGTEMVVLRGEGDTPRDALARLLELLREAAPRFEQVPA
jgi:hypothetical protein